MADPLLQATLAGPSLLPSTWPVLPTGWFVLLRNPCCRILALFRHAHVLYSEYEIRSSDSHETRSRHHRSVEKKESTAILMRGNIDLCKLTFISC